MSEPVNAPQRGLLSPRGMVLAAVIVIALYGAMHALGLREDAAILSGTAPPGASGAEAVVLGLAYVIVHFAGVVGAPILIIAAALLWLFSRPRREGARATASPPPAP